MATGITQETYREDGTHITQSGANTAACAFNLLVSTQASP
jgi:hypothetical protein